MGNVKKFYDLPYNTFSVLSKMVVLCPACGKAATVHFDKECNRAIFKCGSCYIKRETVPGGNREVEITAQCTITGRYFRISMPVNKVHGQKVRLKCHYCEESVIGDVSSVINPPCIVFQEIHHAKDPYFNYPLYFQAGFRGKVIWALNREHLQYLIDYLTADLRTVKSDFYETYKTMRSQSDRLPKFMKTAKNREGIIKALTKLQAKR